MARVTAAMIIIMIEWANVDKQTAQKNSGFFMISDKVSSNTSALLNVRVRKSWMFETEEPLDVLSLDVLSLDVLSLDALSLDVLSVRLDPRDRG